MPPAVKSRKEMIRQLVEHSVNNAQAETGKYWLREIFENGFIGYREYADHQLQLEMQLRGLEASPEIADEDEIDDDFVFTQAHI